jgi:hypothetical protein
MTKETQLLLERAKKARILYQLGHISRSEAKQEIQPYIDYFNAKSKEIAKKYNQKPKLISFAVFVR